MVQDEGAKRIGFGHNSFALKLTIENEFPFEIRDREQMNVKITGTTL